MRAMIGGVIANGIERGVPRVIDAVIDGFETLPSQCAKTIMGDVASGAPDEKTSRNFVSFPQVFDRSAAIFVAFFCTGLLNR